MSDRIRVWYEEPETTYTEEDPIEPAYYDECNWKTFERISMLGGAAPIIDDVDTGGGASNAE